MIWIPLAVCFFFDITSVSFSNTQLNKLLESDLYDICHFAWQFGPQNQTLVAAASVAAVLYVVFFFIIFFILLLFFFPSFNDGAHSWNYSIFGFLRRVLWNIVSNLFDDSWAHCKYIPNFVIMAFLLWILFHWLLLFLFQYAFYYYLSFSSAFVSNVKETNMYKYKFSSLYGLCSCFRIFGCPLFFFLHSLFFALCSRIYSPIKSV